MKKKIDTKLPEEKVPLFWVAIWKLKEKIEAKPMLFEPLADSTSVEGPFPPAGGQTD